MLAPNACQFVATTPLSYCTWYVCPTTELQVIVITPLVEPIDSILNAGLFVTGVTTTVKLFVAVSVGFTRSKLSLFVTTVVITLVPGFAGVQVITPPALMVAPAGGLTNPYPAVTAWILGSVAVLLTVSGLCAATV